MKTLTRFRFAAMTSLVTSFGAALACGSGANPAGSSPDGGAGSDASPGRGVDAHPDGRSAHDAGQKTGPLQGTDAGADVVAPGADAACAITTVQATAIPAYLVFVVDRSSSMRKYGKWPACAAALETFFADPSTAGLHASLTLLPAVGDPDSGKGKTDDYSCTASDYVTPAVAMSSLPSAGFAPVIDTTKIFFGTPTQAALEGALTYAQTVQAAHPGDKVLIVLATDGYPSKCGGTGTLAYVADTASVAAKAGVPVYVIGVGPDTDANAGIGHLNDIAEAGGTGSAFFLPTVGDAGDQDGGDTDAGEGADASVTEQAFLAAVRTVQTQVTCKYAIPPAPQGQELAYDKVNVVIGGDGGTTTLPYSVGCADPGGWQYGLADGGTPDEILLCSTACAEAQRAGGSASVAFGCQTVGQAPPK